MGDMLYATTTRDHRGVSVISGRAVTVPAGAEVRIPAIQVECGRTYYDAKARIGGATVRVQVLPSTIVY